MWTTLADMLMLGGLWVVHFHYVTCFEATLSLADQPSACECGISFITNERVLIVWLSEFAVALSTRQVTNQRPPQLYFYGGGNSIFDGTSYAGLLLFNFNPSTSPYKYLWIDGILQQHGYIPFFPLNLAPGLQNNLKSTSNMSATLTYTGLLYQLCDSNTNTSNCQSFNSPSLGELQPGEKIYVVFTPSSAFQAITYNPPNILTPQVYNSYYNISSNIGYPGVSQLVFETDGSVFSPQDLRTFEALNGLPLTNVTGDYYGGIDTTGFCSEYWNVGLCFAANTDVQTLTSLSQYPTNTSLF